MTTKITRRALLGAAGTGVVTLGSAEAAALAASSEASGSREPHYAMVFDQNKCVGCGDCKAACNEANHLPPGISRLLMERQSKSHRVIGKEPCPICGKLEECDCERKYVRVSCQQCQDAPCVTVCPTGAAHHDPETGIVTMDPDRCVGCKYCIVACPYNARFINAETKVADNCDFCLHTRFAEGRKPACVESCKYDALVFGNVNDPYSYISRLIRAKDTVRIRPELGTRPSLRYIPFVKKGT